MVHKGGANIRKTQIFLMVLSILVSLRTVNHSVVTDWYCLPSFQSGLNMSLMKTKATGRCDTSQGGSETVTVSRLVCRTTMPDGHCHDVLLFATDDIDAHPPCGIYILT